MTEQQLRTAHFVEDLLGHAVMQQCCDLLALFKPQLPTGTNVISSASLDSVYLTKAAISGNVRCLA